MKKVVLLDEFNQEAAFTEGNFHAAGDLQEGVCGKRAIDSTYENQLDATVQSPRSGNDHLEND